MPGQVARDRIAGLVLLGLAALLIACGVFGVARSGESGPYVFAAIIAGVGAVIMGLLGLSLIADARRVERLIQERKSL